MNVFSCFIKHTILLANFRCAGSWTFKPGFSAPFSKASCSYKKCRELFKLNCIQSITITSASESTDSESDELEDSGSARIFFFIIF